MPWLRRLHALLRPLIHLQVSLLRGLTLGVRGVVTDADGRVLLVEHTYMPGWYLPGGGVEWGETAETALARELVEEAGVEIIGRPRLVSFHSNERRHPGDHVLIYRVGEWRPCEATSRGEIKAVGWYALDALPADATPATRRRLTEVFGAETAHPEW